MPIIVLYSVLQLANYSPVFGTKQTGNHQHFVYVYVQSQTENCCMFLTKFTFRYYIVNNNRSLADFNNHDPFTTIEKDFIGNVIL